MTEGEHPGFPPRYWDMLAKAAQEMDKAEACSDCMVKWRNHGPSHYRAFKNVENCSECAIRAALPVERAVLDWQYEHDPLKTVVKKIVDAYRSYWKAKVDKHLEIVEKKGAGCTEDIQAVESFWQVMAELDSIIPKQVKEE